jgi:ubiquinone/menaquinone biosynthesis C-methylase UbiE
MAATFATLNVGKSACDYALGYTSAEHDRLIRQATLLAPITERFFNEAGVGPGQRILDLGSGVGDVSMVAAKLVGPSGEVVGVDRDASSLLVAEARVRAAGFHNIRFMRTDVSAIPDTESFDAAVGRFILMFLPDPFSVLKSVARLVCPGGVLAFQEVSWIPMLALGARLPLWSRVLDTIHQTLRCSSANPEMGTDLYNIFLQLGLPAPRMHMDIPLGNGAAYTEVILGVLSSLRPLAERHHLPLDGLGDFETLPARIQGEIVSANTVVCIAPLVSAWSRKGENTR